MKKIILFVVCGVVLIGGIYLYTYLSNLNKYRNKVEEIEIHTVDLSKVKDGTYTGKYDAIFVGANVSVTVKDNKITDIKLINHKTDKGKSAEIIPQKVISAQSLEVDTISGATNSSKIILKAIENALESGKQ